MFRNTLKMTLQKRFSISAYGIGKNEKSTKVKVKKK